MAIISDREIDAAVVKEQLEAIERAHQAGQRCIEEIRSKVLVGQDKVVQAVMTSLYAGGNVNLIAKPGLGKTRLFENLGAVLALDTRRIQFTSDLMPADIIGTTVKKVDERGNTTFPFLRGPVFTQLSMGDEINRASPRTQSAMLQAMQDKKITIDGADYFLPKGFNVIATRNPIEQEGVNPLPEAQEDRFLTQIFMRNIKAEDEKRFVDAVTSKPFEEYQKLVAQRKELMNEDRIMGIARKKAEEDKRDLDECIAEAQKEALDTFLTRERGDNEVVVDRILQPTDMIEFQALSATLPMGEDFYDKLIKLGRVLRTADDFYSDDPDHIARKVTNAADDNRAPAASEEERAIARDFYKEHEGYEDLHKEVGENLAWGAGPRAMLSFAMASRARAMLDGRTHPDVSDLQALAKPILRHRIKPTFKAQHNGVSTDELIDRACEKVLGL